MTNVCEGCKHNNNGCLKNKQPNKYGCMSYSKLKVKKEKKYVVYTVLEFIFDIVSELVEEIID